MRLTGMVLVIIAVILVFSQWGSALSTDFSPEAIKQLIAEGKAIQSDEEYEKYIVRVTADGWDDYLKITTTRTWIRYLAWQEWQYGNEVDPSVINFAIKHATLLVCVYTFGNTKDFTQNAHIVMIQGEKTVLPVEENVLGPVESHLEQYRYRKTFMSDFRYSEFDPNEPVMFIFTRDGEVIAFDVDLAAIE